MQHSFPKDFTLHPKEISSFDSTVEAEERWVLENTKGDFRHWTRYRPAESDQVLDYGNCDVFPVKLLRCVEDARALWKKVMGVGKYTEDTYNEVLAPIGKNGANVPILAKEREKRLIVWQREQEQPSAKELQLLFPCGTSIHELHEQAYTLLHSPPRTQAKIVSPRPQNRPVGSSASIGGMGAENIRQSVSSAENVFPSAPLSIDNAHTLLNDKAFLDQRGLEATLDALQEAEMYGISRTEVFLPEQTERMVSLVMQLRTDTHLVWNDLNHADVEKTQEQLLAILHLLQKHEGVKHLFMEGEPTNPREDQHPSDKVICFPDTNIPIHSKQGQEYLFHFPDVLAKLVKSGHNARRLLCNASFPHIAGAEPSEIIFRKLVETAQKLDEMRSDPSRLSEAGLLCKNAFQFISHRTDHIHSIVDDIPRADIPHFVLDTGFYSDLLKKFAEKNTGVIVTSPLATDNTPLDKYFWNYAFSVNSGRVHKEELTNRFMLWGFPDQNDVQQSPLPPGRDRRGRF